MQVGKAIYDILSNSAGVSALVGSRIYPELAQQKASRPYIVYKVHMIDPEDSKQRAARLDSVYVYLQVIGDSYAENSSITAAIRAAMDRYSGTRSVGGEDIQVQSIRYISTEDRYSKEAESYVQESEYKIRLVV